MAKLVNLQINQLQGFRIMGKAIYTEMGERDNPIPSFWEKCFNDGTFNQLDGMND